MKPENRNQLIRGKVVAKYGNAGIVDFSVETLDDADRTKNTIAVTPWYRHDELTECEQALKRLADCYAGMAHIDGVIYAYEYKNYKRGAKDE